MKLLFDQNISYKIKNALSEDFPASIHVSDIKMNTSTDTQIWEYHKRFRLLRFINGFRLTSKSDLD